MTRIMLSHLEKLFDETDVNFNFQSDCLLQGVEPKVYKPLMTRETCGKLNQTDPYFVETYF